MILRLFRRGTRVDFKQGIINRDVNWHLNYVPLPADHKGNISRNKMSIKWNIEVFIQNLNSFFPNITV